MLKKTICLVAITVMFIFSGCTQALPQTVSNKDFLFNPDVLRVVFNDSDIYQNNYLQENGLDYTHYMLWAGRSILDMYEKQMVTDEVRGILSCLMDTFLRHGYFPRPMQENLAYGWRSSMDAPTVAAALIMAYELTKEESYLESLDMLIPYMKAAVSENGYVILKNGHQWMLEYAWDNITEKDAKFVLNGSLYGASMAAFVAAYTKDGELRELVLDQIKAYQEATYMFENQERSWYYYAILPHTKNTAPKLYIEINAFNSLAILMQTPFFESKKSAETAQWLKNEAESRQKALGEMKKTYTYTQEDGTLVYSFCRYSAPHPYMIDLKIPDLEFYDKDGKLIQTANFSSDLPNSISEYGVVSGLVSEDAVSVEYYHGLGARRAKIGMGSLVNLGADDIRTRTDLAYSTVFADDLREAADGLLSLDSMHSDAEWGAVLGTLDRPQPITTDDYFVIEVENMSELTMPCGIDLYDTQGTGTTRTLTALLPGKNLLIFNIAGFIEKFGPLKDINNFRLRIYTNRIDDSNADISLRIGQFIKFDNTVSLHDYVSATEYRINQQQ